VVDRVGNAPAHAKVAQEGSVSPRKTPARHARVLGQSGEKRPGVGILEREEREPSADVEASDGTRREAAEPSGRVVEEHRAA
jgi:hypothetical protein